MKASLSPILLFTTWVTIVPGISNLHNFRPGMDFLNIFSAQNDCIGIGYLMGTEIFSRKEAAKKQLLKGKRKCVSLCVRPQN